jgi:hypothetical protein
MHDKLVMVSKVREYTGEIRKHTSLEYITTVYATGLECTTCMIPYYENNGF